MSAGRQVTKHHKRLKNQDVFLLSQPVRHFLGGRLMPDDGMVGRVVQAGTWSGRPVEDCA